MFMTRRGLLATTALALPAALIAGCADGLSLGTTTQTLSVSLPAAQAEAAAILAAIQAMAPPLISVLPAAQQVTANQAETAFAAAVNAFDALPPGAEAGDDANAVIAAAEGIVPVLDLPADTTLAIDAGLTFLSALVSGLPTVQVTVPVSSSATASAALAPGAVAAPIPIPVH